MANIQCEINKIFPPKGGKFGMSLKPLEDNEDIKSSNSYKEQYNNFTCNLFIDNDEMPDWAKEGNKISFSYYVNKGWVNIDNDKKVKLITDDIDSLDDDLDDSFDTEKLEAESKGETFGQIDIKVVDMIAKYRMCLKAINEDEYLGKLDNGLKKDIATSFFIQLNR
jgi:hypothetical protein